MDLTPRPVEGASPRRSRRWAPILVLVLVLTAGGVIVANFLTNAIDYYCNVDEVGVRDGCDGGRRLRVQGQVVAESLRQSDGDTLFTMEFAGRTLDVRYAGDPGGIFQECIPVVAHGRLVGDVFESDRIEVKHSNQYAADNGDRLTDAGDESAECAETS